MNIALSLFSSLPAFGLWVVAIVLSVSRWERHPTASALVVTGGVLQLVASAGQVVAPMMIARAELATSDGMMLVYGAMGIIRTGGLACLIGAVFSERATRSEPPQR